MAEKMRLDTRETEREPVLAKGRDRLGIGQQCRACALEQAPRARCPHVNSRVGIDEPAVISGEQIAALRLRDEAGKGAPCLRKDGVNAVKKPVDLRLASEEDTAQHKAAAAFRM